MGTASASRERRIGPSRSLFFGGVTASIWDRRTLDATLDDASACVLAGLVALCAHAACFRTPPRRQRRSRLLLADLPRCRPAAHGQRERGRASAPRRASSPPSRHFHPLLGQSRQGLG